MSREQISNCPECGSLNTEHKGRMVGGAPVAILHCYHCNNDFHRVHQLDKTKIFPYFKTVDVTWERLEARGE